jgi:tRNA pseudouridine38-40 synthase
MVRNIVGTLLEVGRGKHPPQWIDEVIRAKNRDKAGPTAPAHGLFLKEVHYEPFDDNAGPNGLEQNPSA